jgi:hypothetical protein
LGFFGNFLGKILTLIDKAGGSDKDVRTYLRGIGEVNDSQPTTKEKLLSVDGYFFNNWEYESSLYFLLNNENITNGDDLIHGISKKIFEHFEGGLFKKYDAKAEGVLAARFPEGALCGNLFVICLPKEKSETMQYRSHPYGKPCMCHFNHQAILEQAQNNQMPESSLCHLIVKGKPVVKVPQYRLYTPALRPEDGVKSYLLTPFSKMERKKVKGKIQAVVVSG